MGVEFLCGEPVGEAGIHEEPNCQDRQDDDDDDDEEEEEEDQEDLSDGGEKCQERVFSEKPCGVEKENMILPKTSGVMGLREGRRCAERRVVESRSVGGKCLAKEKHVEEVSLRQPRGVPGNGRRKREKVFFTVKESKKVSCKKKVVIRSCGGKVEDKKHREDLKRPGLKKLKIEAMNSQGVESTAAGQMSSSCMTCAMNLSTPSFVFLELSLQRCAMLDALFILVDKMVLAVPPGNGEEETLSILDESMYKWMTQDRCPRYHDRFSAVEKRLRLEALEDYYHQRRAEHRCFLERIPPSWPLGLSDDDSTHDSNRCSKEDGHKKGFSCPKVCCGLSRGTTPRKGATQRCLPSGSEDEASVVPEVWIDRWLKEEEKKKEDKASFSTCGQLDFLMSRTVRMSPVLDWSLREIGLFELTLCYYGPNFHMISQCIGSKSYKEAYSFYVQVFKLTLRYKIFKQFKVYTEWWHALH